MNFVDIIFASFLANNLMFFHFFGVAEYLGSGSAKDGVQRTLVLTLLVMVACAAWWVPDHFLLQAYHLEFLRTLLLLVVLWAVSTLWTVVQKSLKSPWPLARDFLLHSFLVGAVLLVGSSSADLVEVMTAALAVCLGYACALVLLAAVNHRLSREAIPAFIHGLPLQLVTLGVVWLVLRGLAFQFAGKAL